MKKIIRECAFETNSSAVHSLLIDPKGLAKNKLKMKDGYVITDFGTFGKEDNIYKSQNDKLSYLITELYYIGGWDSENIENMYQFKYIVEAIQKHDPNVLGVKILRKKEPALDHQVVPEYGESRFVNYWDIQSIINFLFNKYIWIETSCD